MSDAQGREGEGTKEILVVGMIWGKGRIEDRRTVNGLYTKIV